jgi:hypothetical protein
MSVTYQIGQTPAAGTFRINAFNTSDGTTAIDPTGMDAMCAAFFGDQA